MKKIWIFILITFLICFTSCSDKKDQNKLLSIELSNANNVQTYQAEEYIPENIYVFAIYEKEKIDVTSDASFSSIDTTDLGTQEVIVSYQDKTASYNVEVVKRPSLSSISLVISREPNKKSYFLGEELDLSGLQVSAINDGTVEAILDTYLEIQIKHFGKVVSGFDEIGQYEIVISTTYRGQNLQISYYVDVMRNPDTLPKEQLRVDTTQAKVEYLLNESLDMTGVVVYIEDESGNKENILLSLCTVEILFNNQVVTSLNNEGTYTIRVTFANMIAYYGIIVNYVEPVKKIVLDYTEAQTVFLIKEPYNSKGLLIQYYENDILKTIVNISSCQIKFYLNGVEHLRFDMKGTYQIVIDYQGITESYYITVM